MYLAHADLLCTASADGSPFTPPIALWNRGIWELVLLAALGLLWMAHVRGGGGVVLCVVQPSTTSHQQRQRQSIEQLVSGVGGVFWLKAADVLLRAACMPVSY
jgi:hypothetical protein